MKYNKSHIKLMEPIFSNLIEVIFEGYPELTESIISLKGNVMIFNANVVDGIIPVMKAIDKYLQKNVFVIYYDKTQTILVKMKLNNFEFGTYNNLLDFDYADDRDLIKNIEINFTYSNIEFITE